MRTISPIVRGLLAAGIVALATLGPGGGAPVGAHEADISITFDSSRTGPYAYTPGRLDVGVGATVTWENHDDLTDTSDDNTEDHPTNCSQNESRGECPWNHEPFPAGGTFSVTFPEPGTFQYFCLIHPYMVGTIVVGDGNPPAPEPEPSASPSPSPSASADPTPTPGGSDPDDDQTPGQDPATSDDPEPAASEDDDAEDDEVTDSVTTSPSSSSSSEDDADAPTATDAPDDQDGSTGVEDSAPEAAGETRGTPADRGVKTLAVLFLGITGFYVISAYRDQRP